MTETTTFSCAVFGFPVSDEMESRVADVVEARAGALLSLGCRWNRISLMLAADVAAILGVPAKRVRLDLDPDEAAQADGHDSWLLAVVVVPVLV